MDPNQILNGHHDGLLPAVSHEVVSRANRKIQMDLYNRKRCSPDFVSEPA